MMSLRETSPIVQDLLHEYGLLALFIIFVIEGAMLLYFAPSESLVPAAVVLLGDSDIDYLIIILIAVAGATVGQTILFIVSKRTGREYLIERRWLPLSDDWLNRFERWFTRWGLLVVSVSNSLPFTRGMLTVPAGLADTRITDFVIASAIGTLVFETMLAAITLGLLDLVY